MKNLHIGTSPLTGTIYAANIVANGTRWGANKKDVTIEALVAVAEHVQRFNAPVVISKADGTPEYEITVKALNKADK